MVTTELLKLWSSMPIEDHEIPVSENILCGIDNNDAILGTDANCLRQRCDVVGIFGNICGLMRGNG